MAADGEPPNSALAPEREAPPAAAGSEKPELVADANEVGMNTRLAFAVPLLRALIQTVAESEGDWNYLNVRLASGPWIGVARRSDEDLLIVSTNHGDVTSEPYPSALDEILVEHGFKFVPEHQGYLQFVGFESDTAFGKTAVLMVGTFVHAWSATLADYVGLDLHISLPPAQPEATVA
jgi:hypothetical protein